jgi:hypothetical protein
MKKILFVLALALLAPIAQAQASGLDFNVGLNIGLPFAAAHVYTAAPVYYQPPVRVCQVEKIRYMDGYSQRRHGYESWPTYRHAGNGQYRESHERNRGWDRGNHYR